MDESSDFTFCKVDSQVDDDPLGSPKLIPNIEDINLQDIEKKTENVGEVSKPGTEKLVTNVEDSVNQKEEQKTTAKKAVARTKVPFEKGYSQMDWLKITRTVSDLAGTNGRSNRRLISMDEVKQHKSDGAIWTVLKGCVYNISPYLKYHPGGVDMLMKAAGKDCTSLFNKYHAWVNAEFLLEKCLVGMLDSS